MLLALAQHVRRPTRAPSKRQSEPPSWQRCERCGPAPCASLACSTPAVVRVRQLGSDSPHLSWHVYGIVRLKRPFFSLMAETPRARHSLTLSHQPCGTRRRVSKVRNGLYCACMAPSSRALPGAGRGGVGAALRPGGTCGHAGGRRAAGGGAAGAARSGGGREATKQLQKCEREVHAAVSQTKGGVLNSGDAKAISDRATFPLHPACYQHLDTRHAPPQLQDKLTTLSTAVEGQLSTQVRWRLGPAADTCEHTCFLCPFSLIYNSIARSHVGTTHCRSSKRHDPAFGRRPRLPRGALGRSSCARSW